MRSFPLSGILLNGLVLGAALATAACQSTTSAGGSPGDAGSGGSADAGSGGSGGSVGADAGIDGSSKGGAGGNPTEGGGAGGLSPADGGAGRPDSGIDSGSGGAGGVGGSGGIDGSGGSAGGTDGGGGSGYSQAQDGTGTLMQSSGNGNDYDRFVWDDFIVPSAEDVVELRWQGGYALPPTYPSGPIQSFDISFWTTVANQPDIGAGPAVLYEAVTATETSLGTFGGNEIFEYAVRLPSSFHVQAGTRYWVAIGAFQPGVPGWGIASGSGGNGALFESFVNYAGGTQYRFGTGDAAFTLVP